MNDPHAVFHSLFIYFFIAGIVIVILMMTVMSQNQYKYWARRRELENEELQEQLAFERQRRQRAQAYFLEKLHAHDREMIDDAVEQKRSWLDWFRREPEPEQVPLRVHGYTPPPQREPRRYTTPPRPRAFRQPEKPAEPRERVIVVTEPPRREPPRTVSFWGNDDDDVIDITPPSQPHNPHRAMPQIPLLGQPKNRGGRPRKYPNGAARKRAHDQRQRKV